MTDADGDLACLALREPLRLMSGTLCQWESVIRQAARADVLGRLAVMLDSLGLTEAVPPAPRLHLTVARQVVFAQHQELRREMALILAAVKDLDIPVVFLKGAAYVAANLPAARGRLCSDIDILVPKSALSEVEGRLMLHGWMSTHHDAYDQRYYREWMHELPPMQHVRRGTVIDVHHGLLPETVRRPPNAALLLAAARAVPGLPGAQVLDAPDMVLHSMTHLFHNEEFSHGLRDLSDVDLLLRHHGDDVDFWASLLRRASTLHLQRNLYYGLFAVREAFGTPVPAQVWAEAAPAAPTPVMRALMQGLWRRGLRGPHAMAALPWTSTATLLLYLRAHWLRMPPLLLARHLSIKAWKRATVKPVAV